MKRIYITSATLALLAFIVFGVGSVVHRQNSFRFRTIELQDTTTKLKLLQEQYDTELKSKDANEERLKQLEKEKEELQKQVVAKQEAKRVADAQAQQAAQTLANAVTQTKTVYAAPASVTGNCGDNQYKQFIYQHESGCRTTALNSIGCYGIGQACPASKIAHCGSDFACQDAWFSNYAISRYGSWAGAYQFWVAHNWW